MNIVLVGSVNSSLRTLQKLLEHQLPPVAVFGLQRDDTSGVSAYENLEPVANDAGIPFHGFSRINEQADAIKAYEPDLLFVVGISQLVSEEIMSIPKHGCVGFHPTALPLGRGRAPVAWILLDNCPAASTYFKIGDGVDDGPIYAQEPVTVLPEDDAESFSQKMLEAGDRALDRWIPELAKGNLVATPQDHSKATYYGKRTDEDGCINWCDEAVAIIRLIRATTNPYPGAYALHNGKKIRIWKAELVHKNVRGVTGSIVGVESDGPFTVQTRDGYIRVLTYTAENIDWRPIDGMRLEIHYRYSVPN